MRGLLNFLVWIAAIGGIVWGALYWFLIDVWTVPKDDPLLSASIQPTLQPGDLLIIMRQPSVDRGNLVRCADPQTPGRFVVGRAMAKGGEHVEIGGGSVTVDKSHSSTQHACDRSVWSVFDPGTNDNVDLKCSSQEYAGRDYDELYSSDIKDPPVDTVVETGKWYLVSDDRHVHLDSRDFGAIDPRTCQHVVLRVIGAGGFA